MTKFSSVPLLGSLLHIWSPSEAMLRHIQNTLEITIYFRSLNTTCDLIKVNIDNLPICSSCYGAKAFSKRFFLIQCKIGFLDRFSFRFVLLASFRPPTFNTIQRLIVKIIHCRRLHSAFYFFHHICILLHEVQLFIIIVPFSPIIKVHN